MESTEVVVSTEDAVTIVVGATTTVEGEASTVVEEGIEVTVGVVVVTAGEEEDPLITTPEGTRVVTTPRRRDGTITMTGDDQAVGEGEDTEGSPHRLQDMTTTGILDTGN